MRWGKTFTDERDWFRYNEEQVVRGEFLLDFEWVKSWDKELDHMNFGKIGAKYKYPKSLIEFQAIWAQWLTCRQLEGLSRRLVTEGILPAFDDYTTIWRRIQKIEPTIILPTESVVEVAADGSGFKMNCKGEYRATKYNDRKRKKFIKVVITADPRKKKLLSVSVSIEGEGKSETEYAIEHMEYLISEGKSISKTFNDGAFDSRNFFNFLNKNDIASAVKIRTNASTKSNGSTRRAKEVREYKEKGYQTWANEREYGMRWPGTEGIFSAVKRIFGERVRSKTVENMCKEANRRFWAYDQMSEYAKNR